MKHITITIFLLFSLAFTGVSQSFLLADDATTMVNGADVFQAGPSDTLQLITWLHLTNNSSNRMQVMMKKEEITMLPGGSSSICWAGYCYGPEIMVSIFPLTMLPGETVSGCFAHFGPNGCRGETVIRWTFFSESDPSDSMSVTVHYSTFPSALANLPDSPGSMGIAGPIPADNRIILRHSIPPGKEGRIELRNQAGQIVIDSGTIFLSGTVVFNSGELSSGIYFCTLVVDRKRVMTRKVPVYH